MNYAECRSMIIILFFFFLFQGQFQELELEKKKVRSVKKTFLGPTIKYISTTTPEIAAVKSDTTANSLANNENILSEK